MPFLPPNQQLQSTEGKCIEFKNKKVSKLNNTIFDDSKEANSNVTPVK